MMKEDIHPYSWAILCHIQFLIDRMAMLPEDQNEKENFHSWQHCMLSPNHSLLVQMEKKSDVEGI